jgi:hypothetical protein
MQKIQIMTALLLLGMTALSTQPVFASRKAVQDRLRQMQAETRLERELERMRGAATRLVDLLSQEKYGDASGEFGVTAQSRFTPDTLKQIWQGTIAHSGHFKRHTEAHMEVETGGRVAIVPCEFEMATVNVTIAFDADHKITELRISTP